MKKLPLFIVVFFVFLLNIILFTSSAEAAIGYVYGNARWQKITGAAHYNVYYKETGETTYTHAVADIPATLSSYKITYLKPGVRYWYVVQAIDASGKEMQWSGIKKLRVDWMP